MIKLAMVPIASWPVVEKKNSTICLAFVLILTFYDKLNLTPVISYVHATIIVCSGILQ